MLRPPLGVGDISVLFGAGACVVGLVIAGEPVLVVVLEVVVLDFVLGEVARLQVTGFSVESCLMNQAPLFVIYGVSGGVVGLFSA